MSYNGLKQVVLLSACLENDGLLRLTHFRLPGVLHQRECRSLCLQNPSHNRYYQYREIDGIMRQGAALAIIGYARVSTTDQDPQLQLDALSEAGAPESSPTMA